MEEIILNPRSLSGFVDGTKCNITVTISGDHVKAGLTENETGKDFYLDIEVRFFGEKYNKTVVQAIKECLDVLHENNNIKF